MHKHAWRSKDRWLMAIRILRELAYLAFALKRLFT